MLRVRRRNWRIFKAGWSPYNLDYIESQSVYADAPLTWPLCSASTKFTEWTVCTAGLKRLSAILLSYCEENDVRFFAKEYSTKSVDGEENDRLLQKFRPKRNDGRNHEFKSSGSADDRSIPDYYPFDPFTSTLHYLGFDSRDNGLTKWRALDSRSRIVAGRKIEHSLFFAQVSPGFLEYYNISRLCGRPTFFSSSFSPSFSTCRVLFEPVKG